MGIVVEKYLHMMEFTFKVMNTLSGGDCSFRIVCLPTEKMSTLKGKNLLPFFTFKVDCLLSRQLYIFLITLRATVTAYKKRGVGVGFSCKLSA